MAECSGVRGAFQLTDDLSSLFFSPILLFLLMFEAAEGG